jgi:hypothetical protein
MKVRANARYTYDPCMMDVIDPPLGVQYGQLKPKCNTMGHAHIAADTNDDIPVFLGLVNTHSLRKGN